MTARIDVRANRAHPAYGLREQIGRLLWWFCTPVFRLSPRPFWNWRAMLLRWFGAKVGEGVHVHPSVRITMPWNLHLGEQSALGDRAILYAIGLICIGPRTTISQYAHLCAGSHDYRDPARPVQRLSITVGSDAWVCADAFVGPDVTIGAGAILGARAVAMRDLPAGAVGFGNPLQIKDQK